MKILFQTPRSGSANDSALSYAKFNAQGLAVDGDGIAEARRPYRLGSTCTAEVDPGVDADGDGVINSIEDQNGTDPVGATSN